MSQNSKNPQINLFRNVMSNPEVAQDFLRMRLHPDLLPRIDLDTLEFKKESYVKEQFRHVHSDVVYQCKLDNELIYLYFLIDSQTPPTPLMPFRMLQYKAALMEDHINQGNKYLPVILSFFIYGGQGIQQTTNTDSTDTCDEPHDSDLARTHTGLFGPANNLF